MDLMVEEQVAQVNPGANGGGATDIRIGGASEEFRVAVAGGGGGHGRSDCPENYGGYGGYPGGGGGAGGGLESGAGSFDSGGDSYSQGGSLFFKFIRRRWWRSKWRRFWWRLL